MRRFYIFLLFIISTFVAHAQSQKTEVRAVWLTTIGGIDWPHTYNTEAQKAELSRILDQLKQAGINTVLLQTRIRATTIYPSSLEPWDGCLTGTPGKAPSYDALQLAIDECHQRGMQLHAWVVTIPVGKWNKLGCLRLRQKYPKLVKKIGDDGFLDPENPETATYLARCCKEIVSRYDVDGIHLDYIRYPETWPKARRGKGVKNTTPSERRANITYIVKSIYQVVKAEKPWVILSCSPIGKHDDLSRYRSGGWNARTAVYQDAQAWLRDGLMDALFPMMYFRDNHFYPFAIDWQERSYGRIVVPGLGIYFLDPHEGKWILDDVKRQMYVSRQLGMGHCYFRSKFLTDNVKGIYDFVAHFDATPALLPPMTWQSSASPTPPRQLRLNGNLLQWDVAEDHSGGDYLIYNVYASADFPVDISKAENLIATRLRDIQLYLPGNNIHKLNYAVTSQDRYGKESDDASQLLLNAGPHHIDTSRMIARTDGRPIALPAKPSTLDARYIVIETLQGQQIAVRRYEGRLLDVSALPDGIYQLRSLGKKGNTHRLGFFSIRRK